MTNAPGWLEHASRRSSKHPWMLGAVLDEYCRVEGVTHEKLAELLGASLDSVRWMCLCRRPRSEHFEEDVTRIAERFQIDGTELAQIIRHVEVVAVFRRAAHTEHEEPMLLAARDRDKEPGR